MKKIYFMLLCAACVAFIGCNKEDKTPEPTPLKGFALIKAAFETGSVAQARKVVENNGYTYTDSTVSIFNTQFYYKNGNDTVSVSSIKSSDAIEQVLITSFSTDKTMAAQVQPFLTEVGEHPVVNNVTCNYEGGFYFTGTSETPLYYKNYSDFITVLNNPAVYSAMISFTSTPHSVTVTVMKLGSGVQSGIYISKMMQ